MKLSPFDPEQQHHDTTLKIIVALERISQAFRTMLWNESKTLSLNPIQIQVLIFLGYHSPDKRKVSYLAQEFNMTKATISDTVKALEQKGLIRKETEPHDTRSYIIHLTEKGQEILNQTSQFANAIQSPVDQLTENERQALLNQLFGIIYHLHKTGIISRQRMCLTCSNYAPGHAGHLHYCRLLDTPLDPAELRIDCPEHG